MYFNIGYFLCFIWEIVIDLIIFRNVEKVDERNWEVVLKFFLIVYLNCICRKDLLFEGLKRER